MGQIDEKLFGIKGNAQIWGRTRKSKLQTLFSFWNLISSPVEEKRIESHHLFVNYLSISRWQYSTAILKEE